MFSEEIIVDVEPGLRIARHCGAFLGNDLWHFFYRDPILAMSLRYKCITITSCRSIPYLILHHHWITLEMLDIELVETCLCKWDNQWVKVLRNGGLIVSYALVRPRNSWQLNISYLNPIRPLQILIPFRMCSAAHPQLRWHSKTITIHVFEDRYSLLQYDIGITLLITLLYYY